MKKMIDTMFHDNMKLQQTIENLEHLLKSQPSRKPVNNSRRKRRRKKQKQEAKQEAKYDVADEPKSPVVEPPEGQPIVGLPVAQPEEKDEIVVVKSESSDKVYDVNITKKTCSCPDFKIGRAHV